MYYITFSAQIVMPHSFLLFQSVRRSNCYMVCVGDIANTSDASSHSSTDLEIGCLIDLTTGLVSFTANGKEMETFYQVECPKKPNTPVTIVLPFISL